MNTIVNKLTIVLLFLIFLHGCSFICDYKDPYWIVEKQRSQERAEYVAEQNNLSPEKKNMLLSGIVEIGMTKKEVFLCWGEPTEKHESGNIWIYGGGIGAANIFYFKDDILVKWEQGDPRPRGWRKVVRGDN